MKFTIGKWNNIFYLFPTIVYINKYPKMLAVCWLKWYVGFDEKEGENDAE